MIKLLREDKKEQEEEGDKIITHYAVKRNRILLLLFLSHLMSYMFPSVVHLHHPQRPPASELLSRRLEREIQRMLGDFC